MAVANDLQTYCLEVAQAAKSAAAELAQVGGAQKNAWLRQAADWLRERTAVILASNERDLAAAPGYGLTAAQIDRLKLTPSRIAGIATALEEILFFRGPSITTSSGVSNSLCRAVMQSRSPWPKSMQGLLISFFPRLGLKW